MSNQIQLEQSQSDSEINFSDIYHFFYQNKKIFLYSVLGGLLFSFLLIMILPKQYEAFAQIEVAKISGNTSGNTNTLALTPVEDANVLALRLQTPSTYTTETTQACGLQGESFPSATLVKRIKVTPGKKMPDIVELSIKHTEPNVAVACLGAVFSMIAQQEQERIKTLLVAQQNRLDEIKQRSKSDLLLLEKVNNDLRSVVYLAKRDEILKNLDEISRLELALKNTLPARLISSIYVSDEPVSPRKSLILVLGLLAALFMTTVVLLWRKFKNNLVKESNETHRA